MFEKDLCIWE